MATSEPSFTIGIEEEYLLVDRRTRELVGEAPASMLAECERRLEGQMSLEFLRSQIEVQTRICKSVGEARADLARLRRAVADVAREHGLAPIAAATHPFADWGAQRPTSRERYQTLDRDLRAVARRLVICGLHVHVGIDDDELRIDLMNQIGYFLPHLMALATSSPFWRGEDTGLKSYRTAVFNELPRTGLPEHFESWGEYQRQLNRLIATGVIDDATKLWWDVRPSGRFQTLEMRVTDIPTRLDDSVAVAGLFQCLLAMLWRLRRENQRWRIYPHMLINENRWRAQRYGYDQGLIDFGKGEIVPYAHLLEEIFALVAADTARLGCTAEIEVARDILARGTSAHRQLAVYQEAVAAGAAKDEALRRVVDWLIEETLAGVGT
ncbi:MAG TPA: carboxylate-amine ligase [Alphaproteobacteria bacterium]|nr:carboxylate-amine ligase [Alphaproteobacteria bacterium]